jgi:putative membrane-bound dehydrogenase-like protein
MRPPFASLLPLVLATGTLGAIAGPAPRVPAGFGITLVVAEPNVKFPMFATFDERGRLFVAESSGLDLYAELSALTRKCQIRLLEDRDGDGVFETARIFADRLVFPMGLAWRDGKLFVADPPELITLEDTDNDGRADQRRVLLTGFGHRDNGSLHGLLFGPDGWLYLTMGEPDGYNLQRADGTVLRGSSGALLRCRPDGSDVTVLCRGFENLVELTFTPGGEMIGTDNWFQKPVGGIRDALVHLIEGGLYPYAPDTGTPQPVTGPPLPAVALFPAFALSGLELYRGTAFPTAWQGQLFSAQHNSRKIGRHQLIRHGATWRTEDHDFVTSDDPDFHPSDVLEDADGSLLVLDTGSWYTQHCPTGRIRNSPAAGGIYRVRATSPGQARVVDPWGLREDWNRLSFVRHLELLADPRPAVRNRAQRALVAGGESVLTDLQRWLATNTNRIARLHGVWVLSALKHPGASAVLQRLLLSDADVEVAAAAARVLAIRPDPTATRALETTLLRGEAHLRLAAAQALAHCGNDQSIPLLWNALTNADSDAFLAHALIHAVHRLAGARDQPLRAALENSHPRVQQAALLLLAQPPRSRLALTPSLLLARLDSSAPELRRTALDLLRQRPEWAAEAAALVRQGPDTAAVPGNGSRTRLPPEAWRELFLAFEDSAPVQNAAAEMLAANDSANLRALLEAFPNSSLPKPPSGWWNGITRALSHSDAALRYDALRAAARWPAQVDPITGTLRELVEGTEQLPSLRLEAARLLVTRHPEPSPSVFAYLLEQLQGRVHPTRTLTAADVLSRCHLSDVQLLKVLASLTNSPLLSPTPFLRTLRKSTSDADSLALVEALGRLLARGWQPEERGFEELLKHLPEPARQRATALRTNQSSEVTLVQQRARLQQFVPLLQEGEPTRGRALFFGAKAGCSVCHAIGASGGTVGPDLTRLGAVRSGLDLLESILFPSATFAQGYETFNVTLKDNSEWTGILVEQSGESILVRETSGALRRFSREEIADLRRLTLSVMPEGLERALNQEEFRDLLAFLQSLR